MEVSWYVNLIVQPLQIMRVGDPRFSLFQAKDPLNNCEVTVN